MARRPIWAATDLGLVRKTNEDCFGLSAIVSDGSDREQWEGDLAMSGGWAVIADGMGGHEAGEVASRIVVETIRARVHLLQTEAGIASVLDEANACIFEQIATGHGRPGMGSTVVGAVFVRQKCMAFNIGDSRLYVMRQSDLHQLSVDDTMGELSGGAHVRSHELTQSLGGTRDPLPLFPHLTIWHPRADDVVILASDGLSDMLSDEEIMLSVQRGGHPARELVDAALRAGGRDNVTTIVIGSEID